MESAQEHWCGDGECTYARDTIYAAGSSKGSVHKFVGGSHDTLCADTFVHEVGIHSSSRFESHLVYYLQV